MTIAHFYAFYIICEHYLRYLQYLHLTDIRPHYICYEDNGSAVYSPAFIKKAVVNIYRNVVYKMMVNVCEI